MANKSEAIKEILSFDYSWHVHTCTVCTYTRRNLHSYVCTLSAIVRLILVLEKLPVLCGISSRVFFLSSELPAKIMEA